MGHPAARSVLEILEGAGRRRYARLVPTLELPAMARIWGLSDWDTSRRMLADIGPGGLSVWLSPIEMEAVQVGDRVYIELHLPRDCFVLSGKAAHRRVVPGVLGGRRILGVAFLECLEWEDALPTLAGYLLQLRAAGAKVQL